jgi:release factor glutamine methyltransferase
MKIRQALREGSQFLAFHCGEDALRHAEWILADALKQNTAYLIAHYQEELPEETTAGYFEKIRLRSQGMPLQYLLGYEEFCGLKIEVTPAVLIPRPETELLVTETLQKINSSSVTVIDVGTGSGCIALAIGAANPWIKIFATDLSIEAISIAKQNASRLAIPNVSFLQGDLLDPLNGLLAKGTVDFIVSNPPYISDEELESLQPEVRDWEPKIALTAGPSGTAIFERLIPQALLWLRPGGWFLAEIGFGLQDKVLGLFQKSWQLGPVLADQNRIPRVVVAQKKIDFHGISDCALSSHFSG